MASYDNAPGKIFIGGISPNTTQDSIQKYFEQFGELCDCVLMQDKATGKSRCFGFVTYKDPQILDDVLSKKHSIDGKEIDCKRAIPRDQQPESGKEGANYRTKKLFVGGLTQTTTEEQFRGYFEQFGEIEDSVIMTDKETGKSRGFGFITFVSEDSVDQVIERYNDNKIDGKWVECKRAQAKDVMQAGKQKGGRHDSRGGPSDNYRRHGDGGSRRDDRSRGGQGGYYQNSPTSQSGGRRGGPSGGGRSQGGQDNYGGGSYYQGAGYGGQGYPGGPRGNYEGAPYGAYPGYDYAGQPGYGAGADGRGPAGGYGYNQDYSAYSNPSYPNPYQNPYNPGYASGYPGQYNPTYGQQGYDMMAGGNPQATNPNATTATASTKTGDVPTSMSQMSANPYAPTGAGAGGYGEGQYNPTAYGYNPMPQGDYSNAGYYGQPGGQQSQGGQAKYGGGGPVGQVQSPSQASGYQRQGQGQSDIGPMKGSAKKGVDQRHYQPY
jgi:RNA recognition motif-containing protein